jgi:acetylornithine deacetylase/succinyl-diaminopimelate desuccinylase-like protein
MVEQHFGDLDPAFVLDEGGSGLRNFFSIGDVFDVAVGEKRILWVKMIARAEPGHGSAPFREAAPHRLIRAANAILEQAPEDRLSPVVAEQIRRLGGESARLEMQQHRTTRPLFRDTISLTMLKGGYKENIIPEQAEVTFDCRLLPDTDPRAFLSNLEQIVNDPNIRFEIITAPDSRDATAPWDADLFYAIEQACRVHAPQGTVTPTICVGGTDARFFRERGVPAYGFVPGLYTADDLKGFHGIDERLSIENLRLGSQIVYEITLRAAAR